MKVDVVVGSVVLLMDLETRGHNIFIKLVCCVIIGGARNAKAKYQKKRNEAHRKTIW